MKAGYISIIMTYDLNDWLVNFGKAQKKKLRTETLIVSPMSDVEYCHLSEQLFEISKL